MSRPRVVAVDYGRKRVGLALADPLRLFAQPFGTYSPDEAVNVLSRLHAEEGIDIVIIGWPLLLSGEEGASTRPVQEYINRLGKRLRGAQFIKWDERYTSEAAAELIRDTGAGRRARRERGRVDAAAAALMLQEYLASAS
jgi:putative holliday junction resolvase